MTIFTASKMKARAMFGRTRNIFFFYEKWSQSSHPDIDEDIGIEIGLEENVLDQPTRQLSYVWNFKRFTFFSAKTRKIRRHGCCCYYWCSNNLVGPSPINISLAVVVGFVFVSGKLKSNTQISDLCIMQNAEIKVFNIEISIFYTFRLFSFLDVFWFIRLQ